PCAARSSSGCGRPPPTPRPAAPPHGRRTPAPPRETCGGARRTPTSPSLTDDVRLHRSEHAQQLAPLPGGDLVLVQGLDQVLDGRIPLGVADLHALVRRLHVAPHVRAGPAGRVTDLVGQIRLELLDI